MEGNKFSFVLLGVLALSVVLMGSACGSKKPGSSEAYQKGSDLCSPALVNDYNQVVTAGSVAFSISDVDHFDQLVNEFYAKYGKVVCRAEVLPEVLNDDRSQNSQNGMTTIQVDSKIAEWQSGSVELRQKLAEQEDVLSGFSTTGLPGSGFEQNPAPPSPSVTGRDDAYLFGTAFCSDSFIAAYNQVMSQCSEFLRGSKFQKARELIIGFQIDYKDVQCEANSVDPVQGTKRQLLIQVNEKSAEILKSILQKEQESK